MPRPISVDVLVEADAWEDALGDAEAFCAQVLSLAAAQEGARGAVSVLLTDDAAMHTLNRHWRGRDKPTNVLSFPAPEGAAGGLLGDVALGFETVTAESAAHGKTLKAHAAHLLAHGFLHLLGFDHEQSEAAAAEFEARERTILAQMGYDDPYAGEAGALEH